MEEFLVGIYITSNSNEKSIINKFNYITLVMGFFRSFAAIAPKLWNQLPLAIRQSDSVDSFKRALKITYLFRESSLF